MAICQAAGGVPVQVPLREELGWRWNIDEVEKAITPKTRVLYLNSPNNPTGGILTRADIERLAAIAKERNLWVISDEAYEDLLFTGEHVSIASLPGMYERTIPVYTMSKSYAITGVRVGYFAIKDKALLRPRAQDRALHHQQRLVDRAVRRRWRHRRLAALHRRNSATELKFRRDLFYKGLEEAAPGVFSGTPPDGAFYAFVKINPEWAKDAGIEGTSLSWAMAEHLIKHARIGCVPGVDFGAEQRRLHAVLHRPQPRRAHRRAGVDEGYLRARLRPLTSRPRIITTRTGGSDDPCAAQSARRTRGALERRTRDEAPASSRA